MSDPMSLVPLPRSVQWTGQEWITDDPWGQLSVGIDKDLPRTDYALSIGPGGAQLTAGSEAALTDGRNTFAQILCAAEGPIPGVLISDGPAYAWRGLMIDVCRHFMPIAELHKMIDAMALHRLNVLHLHLTDDQGWRVEIKGYPRLTEVGAWRERTLSSHQSVAETTPDDAEFDHERHGGFYTQDELRELVDYASKRGITIVPEIDLPGHMQAAIAAYPQFGNDPAQQFGVREMWGISEHVLGVGDDVFAFVRDVLNQVSDIFPGPFVHTGGDECPRQEWEVSDAARARMQEWGLTRVSEIQGKFSEEASRVLAAKGKRMVGWDEVLETHLPDDTVVMVWRPETEVSEATSRGFQTVVSSSRALYFDYYQGDASQEPLAIGGRTTLRDVYEFTPVPESLPDEDKALVLGVQAQLWTEYIPDGHHLEYMAFPRVCALAELAWGSPRQSYREFEDRVRAHLPRLDALGLTYRPLD
ncbi:beta-N-acetylhexosaminidase [Devriesea agamarum]|uniref:beta-N-acetylhexosaminidase n=1 Tax=Devriesea agamarum TaxID=472569 RepID=UPI00071C4704|nr:family 20 glycosylhydrolase [Devriesea agamarum]